MPTQPDTRYAQTHDGAVAYQVFGQGDYDIVVVPDWAVPIEIIWEEPRAARFFSDLARLGRVMLFDKRGSGISDPLPTVTTSAGPALEFICEDIHAVLGAERARRVVVLAIGCGCWPAILLAATAPARLERLVLVDAFPRLFADDDYRSGLDQAEGQRFIDWLIRSHGSAAELRLLDPLAWKDRLFRRWYARLERNAVGPKYLRAFWSTVSEIDVRPALHAISAPTLVINRRRSRVYPADAGRYVVSRIEQAQFHELAGGDRLFYMDNPSPILYALSTFLGNEEGVRPLERILATILFIDIVDSTAQLAAHGDRAWRDLMLRFERIVRQELLRYRGREIDAAGDGYFASFDGPARAIQCAQAIRDAAALLGVRLRTGIHAGECELIGEKIGGIAVHTAARIMAAAAPTQILVSRTVRDLVAGTGIAFEDCGSHRLKGIPEPWQLYRVAASRGEV
ncbi:MAG: adenylate/guanylate cyclase domain-containing protein [Gammaproteobacteria bacterium]